MNLFPAAYFYLHHRQDLDALFAGGDKGKGGRVMLDLARALVPVAKKHYPQFNRNRLLDDALDTLENMLGAPDPTMGGVYPDPTQQ